MFTSGDTQPTITEPPVVIGSLVHLYYDDETFDRGQVCEINDDDITVDFTDWKQRWHSPDLSYDFRGGRLVLIPSSPGFLVSRFHD